MNSSISSQNGIPNSPKSLKQYNCQYLGLINTHHAFPKFGEWSAAVFREKIDDVLEQVRNYSECTQECDTQKVAVKLSVDANGTVHVLKSKTKDTVLAMPVSEIMSFKAETFMIKGKKRTYALLCAKKKGAGMDMIGCYRFCFKNRASDEKGFFEALRFAFQNVHTITGVPAVWSGNVQKRPSAEVRQAESQGKNAVTTSPKAVNYDTNC
eukprot:m.100277 g.100277  ORF g.100277 m.100277 type:complete len:210 (+) comp27233_c0_seq1:75-704(+)